MLTEKQQQAFWRDGFLVVEDVVDQRQLRDMQSAFNDWVEHSREHSKAYGETLDGRPRFDLDPQHSAQSPALRRVNAPIEISQAYFDVMKSSRMTDCVAQLIGPNVKFHHAKINSKLPGSRTTVKWHQDFPFTPHSNDDLITALLMVDDVTAENGPLEVLAGSHKEGLHSLWHDGVFTGAVAEQVARRCSEQSQICMGRAGSVCLMHTRLLHGSKPNLSALPRTLFICVYAAEDAVPYSANPVPTKYQGMLVSGEQTNRVRSVSYDLELPQKPTTASFFDQQQIKS